MGNLFYDLKGRTYCAEDVIALLSYSPYEDEGYVMTEARRKELIELGFPDDGYDYLRHLKELGPKGRKPTSKRDQKVGTILNLRLLKT
jgi:hypothetical protein